jgi:hypothetical protein
MLERGETVGSHTIDNDNKDKVPFLGKLHKLFTRFRTNNNTLKPVLNGAWV